MKIRVTYSELKSLPGFNNKQAECSIELEVNGDINKTFERAWRRCKNEVAKQLDKPVDVCLDDEIPF